MAYSEWSDQQYSRSSQFKALTVLRKQFLKSFLN